MPALQSSALGSGPAPTGKTLASHADPIKCRLRAPATCPPLTRGRRPLAAKGSSERAESRGVCAPACRWAAHATERGPVAPPVAFRTPHATNCRLRAPATSYTRPAPSRGKRVDREQQVEVVALDKDRVVVETAMRARLDVAVWPVLWSKGWPGCPRALQPMFRRRAFSSVLPKA